MKEEEKQQRRMPMKANRKKGSRRNAGKAKGNSHKEDKRKVKNELQ
jgi:hypothetical protein